MKVEDLRNLFLEYFKKNEHTLVPSSSLVPINDETLLFTNAGMVQFKDVFLGREKRKYVRAASAQRCVRAGGKHNDLENVGYTARHHTFFEMLGNFSFGDYFKREAIFYAWEFITKVLGISPEKLWVTVYQEDREAEDIWLNEVKISPKRFSRCGEKDNFWAMGDTGPCGPCTEIFYDHGPSVAGGPPGTPEQEGDRYVEIWNLVFMQYNRAPDGTLSPLPNPSIDTGMGLERLAAVLQGVHDNYDIDLFQSLIQAIAKILQTEDFQSRSLRVIADHIRSCAFLIADGVLPSNDGRGYVLRRLIRRAIRHGHKLGVTEPFYHKIMPTLVQEMGQAYPDLVLQKAQIEKILLQEEIQFNKTLDQGMGILEQDLSLLKSKTISGEIVFKLYDTYGFPVDLTADIAREKGLNIDQTGFEQCMAQQRARAREASRFQDTRLDLDISTETEFSGYHTLEDEGIVQYLVCEGNQTVQSLYAGQEGAVVLDNTPFYAESGGQVGDSGVLENADYLFEVRDTKKIGQAHLHIGKLLKGKLILGQKVVAKVDGKARQQTALNHSATHLLHAALRKVLGNQVIQKGSLVEPKRLRFDFSYPTPMTDKEIQAVEDLVNEEIRANTVVQTDIMVQEEALNSGAMAIFGEKYGEKVRVLKMGKNFSVELCGGTHVQRTGDIGVMRITSETGIASGVRRIEAVTGSGVLEWMHQTDHLLQNVMDLMKADRQNIQEKVSAITQKNRQLEKELSDVKLKLASSSGMDIKSQVKEVEGVKVLVTTVPGGDPQMLRTMMDDLKNQFKTAVIVLAAVEGDKVIIISGVTKNCVDRINAGDLVNYVAQHVGGQGGGRPDMAQAGGNNPAALPEALFKASQWIQGKLESLR